jgi:hypothetical protein
MKRKLDDYLNRMRSSPSDGPEAASGARPANELIDLINSNKALTGGQIERLSQLLEKGEIGKMLNLTSSTHNDQSYGKILIDAVKNTKSSFPVNRAGDTTFVSRNKIETIIERINGAMDANKDATVNLTGEKKPSR